MSRKTPLKATIKFTMDELAKYAFKKKELSKFIKLANNIDSIINSSSSIHNIINARYLSLYYNTHTIKSMIIKRKEIYINSDVPLPYKFYEIDLVCHDGLALHLGKAPNTITAILDTIERCNGVEINKLFSKTNMTFHEYVERKLQNEQCYYKEALYVDNNTNNNKETYGKYSSSFLFNGMAISIVNIYLDCTTDENNNSLCLKLCADMTMYIAYDNLNINSIENEQENGEAKTELSSISVLEEYMNEIRCNSTNEKQIKKDFIIDLITLLSENNSKRNLNKDSTGEDSYERVGPDGKHYPDWLEGESFEDFMEHE